MPLSWKHFKHWTTATVRHWRNYQKTNGPMVIENCRNVCNLSSAVEITFCISVAVTPVRVVSCQGCPTEFLCPTPVPPPLLVVPQSDVVHHRWRSVENPAFMSSLLKWFVQVHLWRGTTHSGETFLWRELFQAITNTSITSLKAADTDRRVVGL